MWSRKTPQIRASAVLAAGIAIAAVAFAASPAVAAHISLLAVDEPGNDGASRDAPDRDTATGPENRHGAHPPSEDGTDDGADDGAEEPSPEVINPELANPEVPPGCLFTHQPLELLI
jgi:hypothetical protein